jgi:hypothetical protein
MRFDLSWILANLGDILRASPHGTGHVLYNAERYTLDAVGIVKSMRGVVPREILREEIAKELRGAEREAALGECAC